jgi:hypothetical protein
VRDKTSSFLQTFINYIHKKLCNIGPWLEKLARYKRLGLFVLVVCDEEKTSHNKYHPGVSVINFFSFIADDWPSNQEWLYFSITFQSSLTFVGNTRSLPKKEPSERFSNRVCSGLALNFKDLTGKGFKGQTL